MSPKFEDPAPQDNPNSSWNTHPDSDFASFSLEECEEAQTIREQYSYAQIPQYSLRVKDLPASERPRDRLIIHGAKSLSTSELLSILLGTGQGAGGLSAVGLGQHILQRLSESQRDPLEGLRDLTVEELMSISGVGIAKATTILAAIELGKRVYHLRPSERTVIDDPASAAAVLSNDLMWQPQEERFALLLLDVKNRLMGHQVISVGTATETLSHPRDIFREVIRRGAIRVIVAHNHPSGVTEPSPEDMQITRQLLQGAQFLNIPLLDHLILGNGSFTSLRQTTNLWQEFPQGD